MNHDHVLSEPYLPAELRPTQTIAVKLSPDRIIRLPLCTPCFPSWKGRTPEFSFGRKPFLEYSGQPVFAELLILRLLESAGWSGRWVSSYGGIKFLTDMPANARMSSVSLPSEERLLFDKIQTKTGSRGGHFDVMAWRGDQLMFCEAKRQGKDALRATQRRWIDSALACGIDRNSMLVVEWSTL